MILLSYYKFDGKSNFDLACGHGYNGKIRISKKGEILKMTIIFVRCLHRWAVVTTVKCEHDILQVTSVL